MSTPIPTEEIPAALAEAMGWRLCANFYHRAKDRNKRTVMMRDEWKPLTDRNHAHLAVEECVRLGLMQQYFDEFLFANRGDKYPGAFQDYMAFALATPEQISRAALKTLAEHRSK